MDHNRAAYFAQAGCYLRAAFRNMPEEDNARTWTTTVQHSLHRQGASYALHFVIRSHFVEWNSDVKKKSLDMREDGSPRCVLR